MLYLLYMSQIKSDIEAESNNKQIKLDSTAISIQCSLKSIINHTDPELVQFIIDTFFDFSLNYNKITLIGIWVFVALIITYAKNNIRLPINISTICRCFILIQKKGFRMNKNTPNLQEITYIKSVINDNFTQFIDLPELDLDEVEFNRPLEACANSYIVNLHQHIIRNFFKYQYKYLIHKIQTHFPDLSRSDRNLLVTVIQRNLLGKEYVPRKNTKIKQLAKLKASLNDQLDKFIKNEQLFLDKYFNSENEKHLLTQVDNLINSDNINPDTIMIYLSYMWGMLDYIKSTNANFKGFNLVPLFTPKMRMFRFEAPILCTIYNISKDKLNFKDRVKVPNFKKNKDHYFNEMFNVRKRFKKIMKRFPYINSIVTDGNAVSLTFQKSPPTIKKKKTDEEKELAKGKAKEKDEAKAAINLIRTKKLKQNQKCIDIISKQIEVLKAEYQTILELELERIYLTREIGKINKIQLTCDMEDVVDNLILLSEKHTEITQKIDKYGPYTHANDIRTLMDSVNKQQITRKKILGQPLVMDLEQIISEQHNNYLAKRIELKGIRVANLEETLNESFQPTGLYEVESLKTTDDLLKKYSLYGGDPGNDPMTYFTGKNGTAFKFHKNEYNDAALITKNKKKNEILRNKEGMDLITRELSETIHKTSDLKEFIRYTRVVLKYWDSIWDFYSNIRILQIKLETHIRSQKAIGLMARRIIERMKNPMLRSPYNRKHRIQVDETKLQKPIILFYGTGNGNMTISNTKNSSSKGPIKRLINELSKYILVILVDEYNTSQLCHLCHSKMEGVDAYNFPSMKKLKRNLWSQTKNGSLMFSSVLEEISDPINRIEQTKELRHRIHILKKRRTKKSEKEIEKKETEVCKIKCGNIYTYQSSYHLRTCAKQHHKNQNGRKLFDRNLTGSENIITVGIWELTTKDRGKYKRTSKSSHE